jgi:serine protease Do
VKYASGSGVVIAKDYVVTNYHVVDGANSLKISIGGDDSNLYDATVAAYDQDKDVAVLHVPGLPLDPVEMGDSDQLVVGDWAICIGNAIGFSGTVTAGIISALDREIEGETVKTDRFGRRTSVVNTMIQVDAAINSGNSGGGMFNTAGQLVGIPTLKYSGSRYSSGASVESIGMCIPINEAKDVINEALKNAPEEQQTETAETEEKGTPAQSGDRTGKPRLGVSVPSGNQQISSGGVWPNGAYIISVEEGSPAEEAGIKAGDILVELNGEVISSSSDLMNGLEPFKDGDTVTVTVWRPDVVEDAEKGRISYAGNYVENIQVTLKVLDNIAQ